MQKLPFCLSISSENYPTAQPASGMADRGTNDGGNEGKMDFTFHDVELLKDRPLGTGSYGAVCMARCDELLCAAKIVHPSLYLMDGPGAAGKNVPLEKFHQECRLLYAVKHPNIVQYLGTWREPGTRHLVLLMELCDQSLTRYLENLHKDEREVPFRLQVDLCYDVALALVYLHKNGLIHRDLSSNNVLLTRDLRAKITDFGMTRLMHSRLTPLTLCPGTHAYMPPESLNQAPHYSHKLDCFSMGVLAIQILTLKFPDPQGERFESIPSSESPSGFVLQPIPEEKRRSSHISLIPASHLFLPLIRQCLAYKEDNRPSSLQICRRMAELKDSVLYRESEPVLCIGYSSGPVHKDKTSVNIATPQAKPTQLAKHTQLAESVQSHNRHTDCVESVSTLQGNGEINAEEVKQKEREIQLLKEKLSALQEHFKSHQTIELSKAESESSSKQSNVVPPLASKQDSTPLLNWCSKGEAPHEFTRGGAVVLGGSIFCHSTSKTFVSKYDIAGDSWATLPPCRYSHFSLAAVSGELVAIGGFNFTTTDKILTFQSGESQDKCDWLQLLKPMPTARCNTVAVSNEKTLVVLGGDASGYNEYVSVVEVMDIASGRWTEATRLPQPSLNLSASLCSGQLYVGGGITARGSAGAYTCSVTDLLLPPARGLRFKPLSQSKKVWQDIERPPATQTTLVTFSGHVLAIGGQNKQRKPVADVYWLNQQSGSWEKFSKLMIPRSRCIAAVTGESIVCIGGQGESMVEIATPT